MFEIVRDTAGFLNKLAVIRETGRDGVFKVEVEDQGIDNFIRFIYKEATYISLRMIPGFMLRDLADAFDQPCEICGESSIGFLNCSCGNHAWCEEHEVTFDAWVLLHADHDCTSECCASGHSEPVKKFDPLFSPVTVSVEETETVSSLRTFVVTLHHKTEEELRELLDELENLRQSASLK